MALVNVNKDNFNSFVNDNRPVLLDFYAEWCGPCRSVLPIVGQIAEERGDVAVGKINVEKESELAARFGVYSIPTLVVLKDGEVVNRAVGARGKAQILALLES